MTYTEQLNFITHFCHDGVYSQLNHEEPITHAELLSAMEVNKSQLSIEAVVHTIRNKWKQTECHEGERLSQSIQASFLTRKQTQPN